SFIVRRSEDIAATVREAFAIAAEGRPGPVLIDLPKDITVAKAKARPSTRQHMRDILHEIQDGRFAREWVAEYRSGNANYKALKQADLDHPIETVGARLRARMPWLDPAKRAAHAAAAPAAAPAKEPATA
ncbi:MAG: hypothetical protein IT478_16545, partial [Xanthomonadales bacterium]|nr:hypothetical protein [Xanthomonadales bacterium]